MAKFNLAILACVLLVGASALPQTKPRKHRRIPKNSFLSPRIIGGENAKEGEFPYQISLRVNGGSQHICGGSLIEVNGMQLIITAAHCVMGNYDYTIVAGSLKLSDRNETGYEQRRSVTRVIAHEEYDDDDRNVHDDIALLLINEPFNLNQYVKPIPLPRMMQETTGDAVLSGWGLISYGGSLADVLQKLKVPIVDKNTCKRAFVMQNILPQQICAGFMDSNKSPCNGDSGGPLIATDGGYLAGIVSYGKRGCNYLGVYTRTSHYIDWIKAKVYSYQ